RVLVAEGADLPGGDEPLELVLLELEVVEDLVEGVVVPVGHAQLLLQDRGDLRGAKGAMQPPAAIEMPAFQPPSENIPMTRRRSRSTSITAARPSTVSVAKGASE